MPHRVAIVQIVRRVGPLGDVPLKKPHGMLGGYDRDGKRSAASVDSFPR